MSESALNTQALCDGEGWIKNPKKHNGYLSCRGCTACGPAQDAPAPALVSVPPTSAAAPPVVAPVKRTSTYCEAAGQTYPVLEKEKTTRKTTCKGCGKVIKIRDEDFSEDFSSIKIPRHKRDPQMAVVPVAASAEVVEAPAPVVVIDPEVTHEAAEDLSQDIDGADDPTLDRHVRNEHPSAKPIVLSAEEMEAYEAEDAESRSQEAPVVPVAYTEQVDHPKHYRNHPSGVEAIVLCEHMNFCRGNALKYLLRAGHKNDEIEDLMKARWYIDREVARLVKEHAK